MKRPCPMECDYCGFSDCGLTEVDAYARNPEHGPFTPDEEKTWAWLCDVCNSGFLGRPYLYPRNFTSEVRFLTQAENLRTNMILEEIRSLKPRD